MYYRLFNYKLLCISISLILSVRQIYSVHVKSIYNRPPLLFVILFNFSFDSSHQELKHTIEQYESVRTVEPYF